MNNVIVIPTFLLMTLLGAVGSYYLKCATGEAGGLMKIVASKWFKLGGALYFISAILNVYLLRFIPYVLFLPLTSITYVWSMVLAKFFLKERISVLKIAGIVVIFCGIVCIVLP